MSAILPLWARRTKSLDALLPILYLRGISTGDFQEALTALLGKDAPNLSPAVISRPTAEWQGEYERWQMRDLWRAGTCTFGRTASSCRLAWKTMANACWC
jgi:transposase-like protein